MNPQALAASWDLNLVSREYSAMAAEFRDKGYSMLLGPISGPLGRSPFSGRLYESFVSVSVPDAIYCVLTHDIRGPIRI